MPAVELFYNLHHPLHNILDIIHNLDGPIHLGHIHSDGFRVKRQCLRRISKLSDKFLLILGYESPLCITQFVDGILQNSHIFIRTPLYKSLLIKISQRFSYLLQCPLSICSRYHNLLSSNNRLFILWKSSNTSFS